MSAHDGQIKTETAMIMRAFGINREHRFSVFALVRLARRHSRLVEISLIKKLSAMQTEELETVEGDIKVIVNSLGLNVSFENRINGWTVRLHDKTNLINNTLGGSDNGYGVGKPKYL